MTEYIIPKGSSLRDGTGKEIAITTIDLIKGDVPMSNHFNPPLKIGLEIKEPYFVFNDKVVYRHPYFI